MKFLKYCLFDRYFAGPIDDHMSNLIIAQLLYLESENPETPVRQLTERVPVSQSLNLCLSNKTGSLMHSVCTRRSACTSTLRAGQ